MLSVLKMIILILSLGMDTLIMSISVGFIETEKKLRIAFTFAFAEASMTLIGLLIGKGTNFLIGNWASVLGGTMLLVVAAWLIFFEDEDGEDLNQKAKLIGSTLVLTAFSISLDELTVGFSIGLVGVPIEWTVGLIAVQAFLFTLIGVTVGSKLKPYLGEWAEKLTGIVLLLLGAWILIEAIVRLAHV